MTKNPGGTLRAISLGLVLLAGSLPLRAEQFGLFTYMVVGGTTVEILDYPTEATGPVEIPAVIAGLPVTSIGGGAFWDCTGLTSVTIPSSVTSIANNAFRDCTGLTSINLPSSVTIPSSVTSIGDGAFLNCTGLHSINVDAGNPQYASDEGVLFNAVKTTLMQYPAMKAGPYIIPSSVTTIGDNAFRRCTGLASITLQSSVTSVGDFAFNNCTGLTSVTLNEGLAYLGEGAFFHCSGLTTVTIPSSVTEIDGDSNSSSDPEGAFQGCVGWRGRFSWETPQTWRVRHFTTMHRRSPSITSAVAPVSHRRRGLAIRRR